VDTEQLFARRRSQGGERGVAVLTNFIEQPPAIETYRVRQHGFTQDRIDLVTGTTVVPEHTLS
jgi:hypothetical protein